MNVFATAKLVAVLAVAVGVSLVAVPSAEAAPSVLGIRYLNAPSTDGVEVVAVFAGSLAERHGLEVGDRILSINGRPLFDGADFRRALAESGPVARLRIRDVRTGGVVYRSVRLF